jgi:predicted aspartyl protease
MGVTFVTGTAKHPGGRGKPFRLRFLVDTGAVYTVLPERTWRALGLKPDRSVDFTLADGTTITRGVSECRIEIEGRGATSPAVLGHRDDGPLLGAVTLETLGLMVDPLTRRLLPMRHLLTRLSIGDESESPWPIRPESTA